MRKRNLAFSLLELILTLAIVAMLIGIAYPAYTYHLVKVRRQNAKIALIHLATRLDQYYSLEGNYQKATPKILGIPKLEKNLKYKLTIENVDFDHFKISAIPFASQAKDDPKCGALSLSDQGQRSISGNGKVKNCW